jgi:hypothetical protein
MSQPLSPGRGHSSDRTDHIWLTTRAHRKVHGYLLNLVPLVLVLRLTVFRQVLPLVLTLFVGSPTPARGRPAASARSSAPSPGVLFGAAAAALLKVRRSADGSVITTAVTGTPHSGSP